MSLHTFAATHESGKEFKVVFKTLLRNLLELRILLPPIYNLDPRFVFVNTDTNEAKIVISDSLFDRENAYIGVDASKDDLRYKSPEELLGKDR
jgi:hypothetical protein